MRVTAEGVETSEQLTRLVADGCGEIQGFHMSRPLPADELRALLADVDGTEPLSRSSADTDRADQRLSSKLI